MMHRKTLLGYTLGVLLFFTSFFSVVAAQHVVIHSHQSQIGSSAVDVQPVSLKKEYWAVLIGINDYPGTGRDLPYSINEIQTFQETLLHGGNWDASHMKVLFDEEATRHGVTSALDWVANMEDGNDVSVVYYAGHGGRGMDSEHISLYDGSFSDQELDDALNAFQGQVVVIIDSCYSGGFIEEVQGPGRVIMTACDKDGVAYQDKTLENGFFGYFVNRVLQRFTKSAEMTFLLACPLTVMYSKEVSEQYEEDYTVHPKFADGGLGFVKIIRFHGLLWPVAASMMSMPERDDEPQLWKL